MTELRLLLPRKNIAGDSEPLQLLPLLNGLRDFCFISAFVLSQQHVMSRRREDNARRRIKGRGAVSRMVRLFSFRCDFSFF